METRCQRVRVSNVQVESGLADLSRMAVVEALAKAVAEPQANLDVLINNAGVYRVAELVTQDGLDARVAVNREICSCALIATGNQRFGMDPE